MAARCLAVAIDAPARSPRTYTYLEPPGLSLEPGHLVLVPVGSRLRLGIVFGIESITSPDGLKSVADVVDPSPLLATWQLALAHWLAERLCCSLFTTASQMLPPGIGTQMRIELRAKPGPLPLDDPRLSPAALALLDLIQQSGPISLDGLRKRLKGKNVRPLLEVLHKVGLVEQTEEVRVRKPSPKQVLHIRLAAGWAKVEAHLEAYSSRRRQTLLRALEVTRDDAPMPVSELRKRTGISSVNLRALVDEGLVDVYPLEVRRDPLAHLELKSRFGTDLGVLLTKDQAKVVASIRAALAGDSSSDRRFLLHGVTGSGKTEVYLRLLEAVVAQGAQAIVLVPEIALTPQTIGRISSRFPDQVAVLHSRLSVGEQFDEWRRIQSGDAKIVVGSRGAIFAPVRELKLIVIDEAHEWTYKQQDLEPRYDARSVAVKLAELTGAVLVLGSATPRVEDYYGYVNGHGTLLNLPERIGETPLPSVEVVDLRAELREGNRHMFSRRLIELMTEAIDAREQVILFLNRRGSASIVLCRDCGYIARCRRCETPLTYHGEESELICHLCNWRTSIPTTCPICWSRKIRFLGGGTQRVEAEVKACFPDARVLRWDRDTTRHKHSHESLLERFAAGAADVLVGTQMIAKGLDLPRVTVVGIVSADVGLHLPDFRAGERIFQLLTQVAGRAGRGDRPGRAIIQTYAPEHYAITAASQHDFLGFYEQELAFRKLYRYPPFSRLVRIVCSRSSASRAQAETERLASRLRSAIVRQGLAGRVSLIGPAPAYVSRLRGQYRWHIVLKGRDLESLLSDLPLGRGWILDVDPISLL